VESRVGMDWCGKARPPPGFDPRTVQPVASLKMDNGLTMNLPTGTAETLKRPLIVDLVSRSKYLSMWVELKYVTAVFL